MMSMSRSLTLCKTISLHDFVEQGTGNNCCAVGDRVPAMWWQPNTRILYMSDGQLSNGNDDCANSFTMQAGMT